MWIDADEGNGDFLAITATDGVSPIGLGRWYGGLQRLPEDGNLITFSFADFPGHGNLLGKPAIWISLLVMVK